MAMDPFAAGFHRVIAVPPLGLIMAGWKPGSSGVRPWRDFPHHVLVLTAAGRADFADAHGRRARVGPGDVLALFPGLAHAFTPAPGEVWNECYLIFSGPAFTPWFTENLLRPDHPVLRLGSPGYWLKRFAAVAAAEDPPPAYPAVARLQALLADILVAADGAGRSAADQEWLTRARALLGDVDRHKPSLALVARKLGCGERSLRQRFHAMAGMSPGAFREQARLERACGLLRTRSVAEVAEALGFCDAFHFSRRFRRHYGIPPRAFRHLIGTAAPDAGHGSQRR
jgi:AraC-like DNA-binding protein